MEMITRYEQLREALEALMFNPILFHYEKLRDTHQLVAHKIAFNDELLQPCADSLIAKSLRAQREYETNGGGDGFRERVLNKI